MIINFLAAIIFYLLPVLIGLPFYRKIIPAFFLGCLIIYTTYIIVWMFFSLLGIAHNFSLYAAYILVFWAAISLIYNFRFLVNSTVNLFIRIKNNTVITLSYLAVFTGMLLMYLFIWRGLTPYPLMLNWDFFEHLTVINTVATGHFSLLGTRLTDTFTFNSYSTLFHILLTLPITLFRTDLLGVYWWIELIHYLLTLGVSAALVKKIFNRHELTIIAILISGLIFESSIVYRSFFFIPQTFTAFLSMLLLLEIIRQKPIIKQSFFVLIGILVLLLMHFIIGPIAILVILIWKICTNLSKQLNMNLLLYISLFGLLTSALFNLLPGIDLTNREEALHLMASLDQKVEYFLNWYGLLLPILVGVGVYIYKKTAIFYQQLILLFGLNLLSLSLLPIAYFLKFYVLAGYFINLSLAFSLYYLVINLKPIFRVVAYFWIISSLLMVFYLNQLVFKNPFYFEGSHSHISQSEMEAAYWLRANFNQKTTLLISDPGSQYIYEALSLINSQGGAYMNTATREKLISINWSSDPEAIENALLQVEDSIVKQKIEKRLFIIGGRYFAWQRLPEDEKMSVYFNIWRPYKVDASDYSYINFLTQNFKVLYQNDEIMILEI